MACSRLLPIGVVASLTAGALGMGCGFITDASGLTGGATDGATDSGAASDGVASPAPGADASDAAARETFCASDPHAFCADFDGESPLVGWDVYRLEPPAELGPSTVRAVSPSRSLRAWVPRREGVNESYVAAVGKIFGGWRKMRVAADVYFEAPTWKPGDSNSALLWIECFSGSISNAAFFYIADSLTGVGRYPENAEGPAFPTDQWTHVEFDFDPIGSRVDMRIGDVTFGRALTPIAVGATQPECTLYVGINSFNDPIPAYGVHYDNVTVDFP